MDILDIDEALKDDSFIFLEDKTHDDISNILQQWKSNNYLPPSSTSTAQTHQQEQGYKLDSRTFTRPKRKSAQNLDLQFTNTANAPHFQHHQQQDREQQQQNDTNSHTDNPMFNLEIGGLVTNMHKSFLHDTSPPSFTSMDTSIDRMNNSLITSADFSNINFLQSTNSLDFGGSDINRHVGEFNLMGKITNDGYTLSDMIRDRKALESLTMSSEGTLIKDTQIGQIDDISLTLSKTASGCSTMDNSTESVEANNRTVELKPNERTFDSGVFKGKASISGSSVGSETGVNRTMVLTDEMIGDITYNLVENSLYGSMTAEQLAASVTHNLTQSQQSGASTGAPVPVPALDETVSISASDGAAAALCDKGNTTLDCQHNITPNNRCETPEGVEKPVMSMKFYESTPQTASVRYNKQHYTPTLKMVDDVNISPINASFTLLPHNGNRVLSDTFENEQRINRTNNINTKTFSGKLPLNATVEMIENIENPNLTFDKQFRLYSEPSQASLEMKNVMDLAQAEANLLASNNDEEEFDHMLDEFSKVELNAEQLKMKKSLDSIKRRFSYGPNKEKTQHREISREAKDMREMLRVSADLLGDEDVSSKDYLNMTVDVSGGKADAKLPREHLVESPHTLSDTAEGIRSPLKESLTSSSSISESKLSNGLSASSASSASNAGERLLSRRSRLYDDFNLSTLSSGSAHGTKTSLGSSYTVHKDSDVNGDICPNTTNETENVCGQNALEMVQEKTETTAEVTNDASGPTTNSIHETTPDATHYRLTEKRERDRDRFKTIKISKNRSGGVASQLEGLELNVPCIDDYSADENAVVDDKPEDQQTNQRYSRRDQTVSPVFNNNKSEVEIVDTNKTTLKINPNYLTYKKPKDKVANVRNLPEIAPAPASNVAAALDVTNSSKPRSLSRPRYLSGLTKLSAVSKATSADELEKSVPRQLNLNATSSALSSGISKGSSAVNVSQNRTQAVDSTNQQSSTELKSPMGIKSKSFHNLSSNHVSTSNSSIACGGGIPAPRTLGLRRPSGTSSTEKLAKTNPNRYSSVITSSNLQQPSILQQKTEEGVFKVPKLVSGLRAPGTGTGVANCKRAGLVRPSSGYYSLSVTPKGVQPVNADVDSDTGRHSPTDSMSSASSRGSIQNVTKPAGIKAPAVNNTTTMKPNSAPTLTKITIGSTGIPKPSGLRPPNSIKRSGLPRPNSFIKADK